MALVCNSTKNAGPEMFDAGSNPALKFKGPD